MFEDKSIYPRLPVSQLRKIMSQSLDRAFASRGFPVTMEQELVLRNLRNSPSISQTDLAALTGQDRNNLSRTLAIMERKGLVSKTSSDVDKRYCEINITPEGERAHDKLWQVLEEWRLHLFKDIPLEDLLKFTETAEKLIENLERIRKHFPRPS